MDGLFEVAQAPEEMSLCVQSVEGGNCYDKIATND